jgi:hypothetical protein
VPVDNIIQWAEKATWPLAAVIFAVAFYRFIAPAIGRHLRTKQAEGATKAMAELNGRLVAAVRDALNPVIKEGMRSAVDERFREMPEELRAKIKGIGEHGARGALGEFLLQHHPIERLKTLEAWVVDHDKDADLRESRIHTMEINIAVIEQVQKGQDVLKAMIADLKEAVDAMHTRRR